MFYKLTFNMGAEPCPLLNVNHAPRRSVSWDPAALELPHYPVLTVRRLAGLLDVSFRAASVAVDQLMGTGILEERTGYARNRIFATPEVLAIINRPFGAEPVLPD